jgi:hypothetical protein
MKPKKVTVHAKAKTALPDSANRPKTKVAGSRKRNTRMVPVLSDEEAKAVGAVKKKSSKK